MLFDTGSEWTWVNSDKCITCKNQKFECNIINGC